MGHFKCDDDAKHVCSAPALVPILEGCCHSSQPVDRFFYCENFNANISEWDTSSVMDMTSTYVWR